MSIAELIELLETAKGAQFAIDRFIQSALEPERDEAGLLPPPYTASIHAARDLAVRVLTPATMNVRFASNGSAHVQIFSHPDQRGLDPQGRHAVPAMAICIATLKAKQAQEVKA